MPQKKTKTSASARVWLKGFFQHNTSLIVIIAAALLIELTSGVMYYSSQNIIQKMVDRLVTREMNAIYLCIRNQLAKVEVTVDNMAWVVADGLAEPDGIFDVVQKMVNHNPSFWGSGVAFVPGYYPGTDKFYEPYAVRRGQDSIQSMQLGADGVDYTQDEYFRIPFTQGEAHWSEPYFDHEGAKNFITTYGVPVRDSLNKVVGVVYADIALAWLDDIINEEKVYKSTQRFLVTGNYHLLAGEDCLIFRTALEKLKADEDKSGYFTMDDEHGNKKHVYFTPVGGMTSWMLINVLDDSDVFRKLRMIRLSLLLPLMLGLFFAGVIVWRSSRNLERLRRVNAEKDRIDGELRVASEIQQSMLPCQQLHQEDVDICGSQVPAREVGGDIYDYYIRDEKLFFCIGDVSGKGAASAMLMGVIHALFRAASAHESNPAHIAQALNEASCRGNESNMFVTFFVGVLDLPTGRLRYCDAGHDAPLVVSVNSAGGTPEEKTIVPLPVNPHLPLGVFDDVQYGVQEAQIPPESTIFLYTDGLTEAMNAGRKQFGLERIREQLGQCAQRRLMPKEIQDTIMEAVHQFVGDAEQSDDLTMLAIRYTPKLFESTQTETLTIKNDIHEVTRFSTFMKTVTEKFGIEQSLARQLRLAVEEAVVNVIDYAYPIGTEGEIEVQMMSDGKVMKVVITDAGVPFDPTAKEKADTTLSAEDRQIGGLGILLVRELMDTINYERADGKNVLTLVKEMKSEK